MPKTNQEVLLEADLARLKERISRLTGCDYQNVREKLEATVAEKQRIERELAQLRQREVQQ